METWDYKMPDNYVDHGMCQSDWNQTFGTAINALSKDISNNELKRLVVPTQLKPLIDSLVLSGHDIFTNKYRVIYIESDMNNILVEGKSLYIINYK